MEIYEKVVTKEKSLFNELGINLKTVPINLGLRSCQWRKEQPEGASEVYIVSLGDERTD
jgi:hypothetical protein